MSTDIESSIELLSQVKREDPALFEVLRGLKRIWEGDHVQKVKGQLQEVLTGTGVQYVMLMGQTILRENGDFEHAYHVNIPPVASGRGATVAEAIEKALDERRQIRELNETGDQATA
jgi:hypothetical protein